MDILSLNIVGLQSIARDIIVHQFLPDNMAKA
jgi:hypothetical protein